MSDSIQRNPHPDFKKVEASRPEWDSSSSFRYTKTVDTNWKFGSGANAASEEEKKHIAINPYEEGRPAGFNYKLLISSIVPRPIAFISTISADGTTTNLAPFSYFNVMNHDPPLFVVGFATDAARGAKDTLRNISETGQCVINIISESFVEAANAASINAPYGVSEWDVSGLTPAYDCETVKAARVKEAVFSIEAKLDTLKEYESRVTEGKKTGTIVILEGLKFWVREDALNEDKNLVDPAVSNYVLPFKNTSMLTSIQVLRPISRLGGITYGRSTEAFELMRPDFQKDQGGQGVDKTNKDTLRN